MLQGFQRTSHVQAICLYNCQHNQALRSPEKASHTARLAPGLPSWKPGWRGSAAASARLPGCSLPATRPIQACRPAVLPPQASWKAASAAARAAPPAWCVRGGAGGSMTCQEEWPRGRPSTTARLIDTTLQQRIVPPTCTVQRFSRAHSLGQVGGPRQPRLRGQSKGGRQLWLRFAAGRTSGKQRCSAARIVRPQTRRIYPIPQQAALTCRSASTAGSPRAASRCSAACRIERCAAACAL